MEPAVEKITLVEDARFDSPKSMYLGRVMGNFLIYFIFYLAASLVSYYVDNIIMFLSFCRAW